MSAEPPLRVRGLEVGVGGRTLLRGIDLDLPAGTCLTIIGPSGAGKTTLLRTLLGLHPASDGEILCNGRPLADLSSRERGRFAAGVPQSLPAIPPLTVAEAVTLGRYPHQRPFSPDSAADREGVAAALSACGLEDLVDRPLACLSGGERQKVLLAAAFAQDPRVLVLDEPTTGLDPGFQIELVGLLRGWLARGRGLLVVSHDLQLPAALGGRMLALRDGAVAATGSVEELLQEGPLAAIYAAPLRVVRLGPSQVAVTPAFSGDG